MARHSHTRPYCVYYVPVNMLSSVVNAEASHFYCAVIFDIADLLKMHSESIAITEILTSEGQLIAKSGQIPVTETLLRSADRDEDYIIVQSDGKDYYMHSIRLKVDTPLRYSLLTSMEGLMGDSPK